MSSVCALSLCSFLCALVCVHACTHVYVYCKCKCFGVPLHVFKLMSLILVKLNCPVRDDLKFFDLTMIMILVYMYVLFICMCAYV